MLIDHRIDRKLILHPFATRCAIFLSKPIIINHRCNRNAQCFDILRGNQNTGLPVSDSLRQAAGVETHNRDARRGRLECGDTQAFGQRRVHEQIETTQVCIQVSTKPGEPDCVAKTQRCRLGAQLIRQIPFTKQDHAKLPMMLQVGGGLKQVAMPFARNELTRCNNHKGIGGYVEFGAKSIAIGRIRDCFRIDGAAYDFNTRVIDAPLTQYGSDRLGDGDDFSEWAISKRSHEPHLGIIDAPRHNGRNIGEARGHAAQNVGTAPAMTMHQVRVRCLQVLRKSIRERQIEIARAK